MNQNYIKIIHNNIKEIKHKQKSYHHVTQNLNDTARSFDLNRHPGLTPEQFYEKHPDWPNQ